MNIDLTGKTAVVTGSINPKTSTTSGPNSAEMTAAGRWTPWSNEFVREHRPTSLLRRAATTKEVVHMIVYLNAPQSPAPTGACPSTDGGTRRSVI